MTENKRFIRFKFRADASLAVDEVSQQVMLRWQRADHQEVIKQFGKISPGLLTAFRKLANGGATKEELFDLTLKQDGLMALSGLQQHLCFFEQSSLLHGAFSNGIDSFVTIAPNSPLYTYKSAEINPKQQYILSRFSCWHRVDQSFILESPLGHAYLILHHKAVMPLIHRLGSPGNCEELAEMQTDFSVADLQLMFSLFVNARVVSKVNADGVVEEEADNNLRQWEFHDLLFHARSRIGRTSTGYGGTYRFWGEIPPPPVVKPDMSVEVVELYQPDLTQTKQVDLSLTEVMESRRSLRHYDDNKPMTANQLGEFLYRVARVQEVIAIERTQNGHTEKLELSKRPYPSGGATYGLELYLTINNCIGIPRGFYHYDPLNHKLCKLSEWDAQVERLLKQGAPIPNSLPLPQVLITIAARFSRVFWKYEAMAYTLVMKECGILYQNMYLVATALGLAPCALGGGNADLFSQVARTDYYEETSVGEFALGSKPAGQS